MERKRTSFEFPYKKVKLEFEFRITKEKIPHFHAKLGKNFFLFTIFVMKLDTFFPYEINAYLNQCV